MLKSQELLMNFKSRKWTVLLLLLLIFLSAGIFIKFSLGFKTFDRDLSGIFLNSFSKNPFAGQSRLNISLTDLKVNLDFNLTEEDKPKFQEFIGNWFGVTEEVKNVSLGVDKGLKAFLLPNLPAELALKISEKSLEFVGQNSPGLQNALINTDLEFATGSAKLSLKYLDATRFQLAIENPDDLVYYATSSGMITASDKVEGLFKSLPRVATIEVNVNGKNISGKVVLK